MIQDSPQRMVFPLQGRRNFPFRPIPRQRIYPEVPPGQSEELTDFGLVMFTVLVIGTSADVEKISQVIIDFLAYSHILFFFGIEVSPHKRFVF